MIDHNMESETKRDSKPLGPKRSAVVVVEDIDSNDQDDDHSVQIQPVIPNDLLSSNHPEEIFEEKLEDDLEDIHDRPAVRDNISSQVPEPRSKYESDKTHLPEKEMSGVNLNEVSAIRAAAQAQIERYYSLFYPLPVPCDLLCRYLEKRSERNKAIARNKQTTSLSGKVESSGRQTSVTPNLPKSTNTKDFISRSEPLQGKSSPQESKSRDPMEQNNRIESILARENRKFQESMKVFLHLSYHLFLRNLCLSLNKNSPIN